MPSGAKKRKAAKKKKQQAGAAADNINSDTNNNNNNPHGNGDPRSRDERESGSGSGSGSGSPVSQGDRIQKNVTDDKSVGSTDVSGSDDVMAVKIEKELGTKEGYESTHVAVRHVEHDKSSSSSSSSSRSSSDDESQASDKKSKEEVYTFGSQVTSSDNVDKPVAVTSEEVVTVVKPVLSIPEEVEHDAIEISTNNSVPDVVESGSKESEGRTFSSSATSTAESTVMSEEVVTVVKPVLSVPEEVEHAIEISTNNSVPDVVESGLEESEGKTFSTSATSTAESTVMSEEVATVVKPVLSVQEEVDHAIEISTNNSVPDVVLSGLKESEEKTFSSSATSTAESSTLVEKTQHLEPHDLSENQPLIASTAPVMQRTSVFSCCGLFDAFTASGR